MWKKNAPLSPAPAAASPRPPAAKPPRSSKVPGETTIGRSTTIHGDITGDGDLLIEGRVQGAVKLRQHTVTIGSGARVEADIHGKRICVDGQVQGDLFGEEVVIRESGQVVGNASAARVTLEKGCTFRGAIDMQSGDKKSAAPPQRDSTGGPAVTRGAAASPSAPRGGAGSA